MTESHLHRQMSHGRMLFAPPLLLQDWDQESLHAFQYWELFLDLLLVAAASSITDQFKDQINSHQSLVWGLLEFAVFYLSLVNAWMLYTHHVTSRFQDASLVHSINLFFYCVGFGLCIVNAGYESLRDFCWGAVLLRGAVLLMLMSLSYSLERAKYTCAALGCVIFVTMVAYCIVGIMMARGQDVQENPVAMAVLWIAVAIEFFGEIFMVFTLEGKSLVPINIEQTKERMGAMELIFLGETVLSLTLIYRELTGEHELEEEENKFKSEEHNSHSTQSFYWVLGWSFLLIFMFLLLYFHMQPEPCDHALRRSRAHGCSFMILHKIMGLAFLTVGVSVKLIVESVLKEEELPKDGSSLMGYAVGSAILFLFIMRFLNYGGRDEINFGNVKLHLGENPYMDRVVMLWWWTVAIAGVIPLLGVAFGWTEKLDPLVLTGVHSVWVFLLCSVETYFSHLLQSCLVERAKSTKDEQEGLKSISEGTSNYGTAALTN